MMNLMSKPKAAIGFAFTGSLQSVMQFQTFLEANQFKVNSMSLNGNSAMEFSINLSYYKQPPENSQPNYMTIQINKGVVVLPEGSSIMYWYTEEQLTDDYDIQETE
jgi:hypothetical protein